MFDNLTNKLGDIFARLGKSGAITEDHVAEVMREIRVALLEADVALPVVKEFIAQIKDKAVGQNIIKGVNPGHQVIKIVHDALVEMLGSESSDLKFGASPRPPLPPLPAR